MYTCVFFSSKTPRNGLSVREWASEARVANYVLLPAPLQADEAKSAGRVLGGGDWP